MMLIGSDFIDNNASFNTSMKRNGPNVYVQAYATSGMTENTPYMIQFMGSGYKATGLAASHYAFVGVPEGTQSVASGCVGWVQIRGQVDDIQGSAAEAVGSVGHAVAWTGGTLYASSSAYSGLNHQIGVLTAAANASTSLSIYLIGVWATPV